MSEIEDLQDQITALEATLGGAASMAGAFEGELARMLPGFEKAMQSAARAFGRAEALKDLRSAAHDDDKLDQARRLRGNDM